MQTLRDRTSSFCYLNFSINKFLQDLIDFLRSKFIISLIWTSFWSFCSFCFTYPVKIPTHLTKLVQQHMALMNCSKEEIRDFLIAPNTNNIYGLLSTVYIGVLRFQSVVVKRIQVKNPGEKKCWKVR